MPRAVWQGQISFGLVNIPVELFSTTQDKSVHFHILSKDGQCRLRQKLYCPETKKEYDFSETARGVEISPNNYVLVKKEELASLKPESGRSIGIVDFISLQEIDPLYYSRSYYLVPEKGGAKAYQLLLQSMERSKKVALAKFVMRQKEYLAIIRPMKKALILETMNYEEEILPIANLPGLQDLPKANAKELDIAERLIDSMTSHFKPDQYKDEYTQELQKIIEHKAKGKKLVLTTESLEPKNAKVIDLMDALKKSLSNKSSAIKPSAKKKSKVKQKSNKAESKRSTASKVKRISSRARSLRTAKAS